MFDYAQNREFTLCVAFRGVEYTVPDVWTLGKVYARLIEDVSDETNMEETLMEVFTPWIMDALSDINSSFYYQSRDYIAECYRQGQVLGG